MTDLGSSFLRRYYDEIVRSGDGILLIAEGSEGVRGFAAGFYRPERFYQGMFFAFWRFASPLAQAVVRRPKLLIPIVYSVGRVLDSSSSIHIADRCELASIAVAPQHATRGIGRELVRRFLQSSWARGATAVSLTTDAEANDHVNRFYANLGFQVTRRFDKRGGGLTNEYLYVMPREERAA